MTTESCTEPSAPVISTACSLTQREYRTSKRPAHAQTDCPAFAAKPGSLGRRTPPGFTPGRREHTVVRVRLVTRAPFPRNLREAEHRVQTAKTENPEPRVFEFLAQLA